MSCVFRLPVILRADFDRMKIGTCFVFKERRKPKKRSSAGYFCVSSVKGHSQFWPLLPPSLFPLCVCLRWPTRRSKPEPSKTWHLSLSRASAVSASTVCCCVSAGSQLRVASLSSTWNQCQLLVHFLVCRGRDPLTIYTHLYTFSRDGWGREDVIAMTSNSPVAIPSLRGQKWMIPNVTRTQNKTPENKVWDDTETLVSL